MYDRGVVELAEIKYRILHLLPISSLLSLSTFLLYLVYRLKCLLPAVVADRSNLINSALYLVAELGFLCQSLTFSLYRLMLNLSTWFLEPSFTLSVFQWWKQSSPPSSFRQQQPTTCRRLNHLRWRGSRNSHTHHRSCLRH